MPRPRRRQQKSRHEGGAEGCVVLKVCTLDEVGTLTGLVEVRRRLLETTELERRLAALEQQQQGRAA